MDITVNLEGNDKKRDFVDFARRLTQQPLDNVSNALGQDFLAIVDQVVPAARSGCGMAPEDIDDQLAQFFKDNNYKVNKGRCRKILEYHRDYGLPPHGSDY